MELLKVALLEDAIEQLKKYQREPKTECVSLDEAYGRILSKDVISLENTPNFNRSTVDGYAVLAKDTQGASETLPCFLKIAGEVEMGKEASVKLSSGECMYVPTGGMLPEGADAMVMVENTEPFGMDQVAIYEAASYGKATIFAGDDTKEGDVVLKKGRKLRAFDMGLLSSLGISEVEVYIPWSVFIISTGDEIVDTDETPTMGKVRDVNTYSIIGLCDEYDFDVAGKALVKDDVDELRETMKFAMDVADIVVLSGGSSKGKKDHTKELIDELASEKAFVHGIAIKPGKPTIVGYDRNTETALIGLPGHPVGAVVLFKLLVGGLYESITGQCEKKKYVEAVMGANIAAAPGRKTVQLVKLEFGESDMPVAWPVLGKSALISTMTEADGYVVMEVNEEGLNKGEKIKVYYL